MSVAWEPKKKTWGDKAHEALIAACKALCCERTVMTEDKVDEPNDFFFLSTQRERLSTGGGAAVREGEWLWSSEEEAEFLKKYVSVKCILAFSSPVNVTPR